MIQALVLAAVVLTPATTQALAAPTIDIDKFDTPYQFTGITDNHAWYGLSKAQCLFPFRGTNLQVISNPNKTTLTFTIGDGHQRFESPMPIAWAFTMDYSFNNGGSVDFSAVDLFMVDYLTLPPGKLPDIPRLYAYDTAYRGGSVGWHIKIGGIYFRRSEFSGDIDWRHIRALSFRQDFSTFPNPTTYDVYRFYATLKPVAVPPAPR